MEHPNNEKEKNKRELLAERLSVKYPDKDFSDEEAFYGQISDDYDDYDKQLSVYKDREGSLMDMMANDPRSAAFLASWSKGEHPMTAFVRQFGKDGLEELLENEDKMDEFAKANEEYLERVAQEKQLEEEYQKNIGESIQSIDAMQEQYNLSDEQVDNALELLLAIIKDGIVGKFSTEHLQMAIKTLNYDTDLANARTEGEISGRNAKIEEKLRKPQGGDGTPNLAGSNNGATRRQERINSIFDVARGA